MENKFQSKTYLQGSRTLWRYLGAFILLFTFAIGNVWGATSTNPATKSYGGKTFLDVAATAANARIKNADSTLVYNATYLLKTLTPAWIDGTTATDKSDSKSNYANLPDYGFLAEASSSSANSNNSGGYSYVKITSAKEYVIYVTGTNSIAFLGKGNSNSSNKWIGVKVEEIDSNGDATVVANAVDNKNYSSSNAITEATTNTSSEALTISPSKYYRVTITSGNTSNCQVWQFRFGKVSGYSVTYVENGHGANQTDLTGQTKLPSTLPTLSESGWIFGGWYTDEGLTTPAVAGATLSANATLYAKWTEDTSVTKYSVTYVLNGPSGDAPTQASVAAGTEITLAAAPSWAGHAFDGWLCSADAAVKAAGSSYTMTAANTTFTAQWHEVDCKIYSLTGGIGSAVVQQADATVNDGVSLILSNTDGIIKLSPASGSFNAGDIVTISGTVGNTTKEFGVKISNAADKKATLGTASVAGTTNPRVATATLSAASDYLYICRTGGTTQTILTCEVHRACAAGTEAGLSYATAEVEKTLGDAKFTNALTNTNGLVLAGYKSSDASVATVDFSTGEVTIVGAGDATITANSAVQTKAGTLYAAGTASYTLTVTCTAPRTPEFAVYNPIVVTHNSATATWDVNGSDASIANYQVSVVKKDASVVLDWTTVGFAAPAPSYTATDLDPETEYTFKIRTVGASGYCEYSPVVTEDFTTTAEPADSYTVIFKDGTTELATQQFGVGTYPSDAGVSKTKPLYTFAAWQKDAADIALDDAFWATVVKDATVTLTARWTKIFASTVDFEAYILANTGEKDDADKAEAYVISQNYALSTKTGTTFDANNSTNNGAYAGLKIKNSGTVLSWNVAAGKVVEFKAGVMVANGSLSINGGAAATIDGGSTGSGDNFKNHYFYSAAEALYTFTTSNGSAEVVKAITIRDPYTVSFEAHGDADPSALQGLPSVTLPDASNGTASLLGWFDAETGGNKIGDAGETYIPTANITLHAQWEAISTDHTLSDLKVGGVTVDGFDPAVNTYYVVLPYGTAVGDIPAISATANSPKAKQVAIQQAVWTGDPYNCYRAQANVQAEDESWGYYDVRFSFAPKDGVSIIKVATTGGTNKTVTGAYAGDGDVNLSSSKKMDGGKYIGFILDGTTLQAGDRINVHTTQASSSGGSHIIFYDNMTDKNELYDTEAIGGTGDNIFTINAAMVGATTAYVYRANNDVAHQWNGYVDYIEVTRAMDPVLTAITIDTRDGVIDPLDDKHFSVTIPYESDLAALTVVPTVIRNAAHPTTPEAVVSNAGAWIIGDNTYRVMDKDGDYTDYTITLDRDVLKHTVSFNTHGGSAVASEEVVHGGYLAAAPADPTKEDYIFQYWSEDEDGAEVDVTTVQINADKEFHAVWASDGAIKLLDGSTVNHTNFITAVTADETVEFKGNVVNYAKFSGTVSGVNGVKDLTRVIAYNATTNKTKIRIYAHNNSTSGRNILVKGLVEGADAATDLATIALGNKEDKISDWIEFNNAANRTIYIFVPSSAGDVYFTQVKVIESGETPMKQVGEAGYALNLNKGRFFGTASTDLAFEGLNARLSGDYTALNSGYAKLTSTSMSFTVASAMTLSVTTNNNKTYYVTKGAAGTDNETAKTGVSEFDLTAGTWYITGGTAEVQITNIAFTAPKCEEPTITPMVNSDLCEGDAYAPLTVSASVSDGGTLHYAWYKHPATGDDEAVGTDAASYTPTADGQYYVIVTNKLTNYSDNSATSNTISVTHFASAAITTAPLNQRGEVGDVVTLSAAATGKNVAYKWYTCDEDGSNEVALDPAQTGTSIDVTITAGLLQWYKVKVTSDCGGAEAKAKVSEFVPTTPANVTTSILWDWKSTEAGFPTASTTMNFTNTSVEELFADVDAAMPNNQYFRSDMLYGIGQIAWRNTNDGEWGFQGKQIRFKTEVAGKVRVYYRAPSSGQTCTLTIDGKPAGSRTNSWGWSEYVEVDANTTEGIVIAMSNSAGTDKFTRVQKIEFIALAHRRTAGYNVGDLGTVCLEDATFIEGANLYELAGLNENGYLAFDEVLSGELEEGKPYLFEVTNPSKISFYKPVGAAHSDDEIAHKGMIGTFSGTTLYQGADNLYYFSGRHIWKVNDFTVAIPIPDHRCYVDYDAVQAAGPAHAPVAGRRRVKLGVQGTQVTTDINNVGSDDVQCTKVMIDGQLYILRGEKMYDATGRLVK